MAKRPDLFRQAEAAYRALTPAQRAAHDRAQRISWVYGNLVLDGRDVTKEQVEESLVVAGMIPPRTMPDDHYSLFVTPSSAASTIPLPAGVREMRSIILVGAIVLTLLAVLYWAAWWTWPFR